MAVASGITANVVTYYTLRERARGVRITVELIQRTSLDEDAELREEPDGQLVVSRYRLSRTTEGVSIFRIEEQIGKESRILLSVAAALAVGVTVGFVLATV